MSALLLCQIAAVESRILFEELELSRMLNDKPERGDAGFGEWEADVSELKLDIADLERDIAMAKRWLAMAV